VQTQFKEDNGDAVSYRIQLNKQRLKAMDTQEDKTPIQRVMKMNGTENKKFARELSRMSKVDRILSKRLRKGKTFGNALGLTVLVQKALNEYDRV